MNYFRECLRMKSGSLRKALLSIKFISRIAVLHAHAKAFNRIAVLHEEIPKASRMHRMKHHHVQRLDTKARVAPEGQQHSFAHQLGAAERELAALLEKKASLASEFEAHRSMALQSSIYQRACKSASKISYNVSKVIAKAAGFIAIASIAATIPTGLLGRFMDFDMVRIAVLCEAIGFGLFGLLCMAAAKVEDFFKTIHKLQKHEKKRAACVVPAGRAKAV